MDRRKAITYIIFGLIGIGIVADFANHMMELIIPILVFGAIFLLYKFPPRGYRRGKPWFSSFASKTGANRRKTKKAKFRVINGNGKKENGEEEPPRYH